MEPSSPHFNFFLPNSAVQLHQFQQPLGQIRSLISECITKLSKLKYLQPQKKPQSGQESAGQFLAIDGTREKEESGPSYLP